MVERTEPSGPVKSALSLISFWARGNFSESSPLAVRAIISFDKEGNYLQRNIVLQHMLSVIAFDPAPKSTNAYSPGVSQFEGLIDHLNFNNNRNITFPRPLRYLSDLSDLSKGIASFVKCCVGDKTGIRI